MPILELRSQRARCSAVAVALMVAVGCGPSRDVPQVSPAKPVPPETGKPRLDELVEQIEKASKDVKPPESRITLVAPPGWTKSDRRALPMEDHGFTVAFDHESGLAVTLYQYTRGMPVVPDDVEAPAVREEMRRAKSGIEQAVELGLWTAAKEQASNTILLGDSPQKALWSRYELTAQGGAAVSDIYVWTRSNNFFKLRCTSRQDQIEPFEANMKPLLTALGSPVPAGK